MDRQNAGIGHVKSTAGKPRQKDGGQVLNHELPKVRETLDSYTLPA